MKVKKLLIELLIYFAISMVFGFLIRHKFYNQGYREAVDAFEIILDSAMHKPNPIIFIDIIDLQSRDTASFVLYKP